MWDNNRGIYNLISMETVHYDDQKNYKVVHCNVCKKKFIKNKYNKIYCSKKCKSKRDYINRKSIKEYLIKNDEIKDDEQLVEEMFQKLVLCPKCKKPLSQYYKKGVRYNKCGENKDLYTCLRCGHNFTLFSLSFRMQHSEEEILKFIKLIERGITANQISKRKLINIGVMTAYRWKNKYCSQTNEMSN